MAKYFLGSVGKAEAFRRGDDGKLTLAFVSKTLTDSGLNISTTKDDIRAGEGAPIQFSFYHDSSVEVTLTDVLWKREYLEAQLGARFTSDGTGTDYISETLTADGGKITLGHTVEKMPLQCADGDAYIVWYSPAGQDDWKSYSSDTAITEVAVDGADGTEYCVRYLALDSRAKVAEITSTIIPEELFLIITAPIFAGDACAASRGKAAGHITFEIPRFQLNGAQEFSMNMSSNQTMSLAGVALAAAAEDCDTSAGKLLRIIEVISNEDWYSDVTSLIVDEDSLTAGEKPVVYALHQNGSLTLCDNSKLIYRTSTSGDYTAMTAAYTFTSGTIYLNINKGNNEAFLASDETVTVSA